MPLAAEDYLLTLEGLLNFENIEGLAAETELEILLYPEDLTLAFLLPYMMLELCLSRP